MILATTVNTSIRIGNTAVNLTSSANVQQLIATAMSSIHYFALTVSLCIFLLAIVRNYTQFGEHVGVRFIGSLLVVLVIFSWYLFGGKFMEKIQDPYIILPKTRTQGVRVKILFT